uniref:Uncharacterized protein n=1 Tax=Micrurus lemniscatus lemniscatus TaxID=129467 RepID=A0A2D4J8V0_MICLE
MPLKSTQIPKAKPCRRTEGKFPHNLIAVALEIDWWGAFSPGFSKLDNIKALVDFNSQNSPASLGFCIPCMQSMMAGEFWELKSHKSKVAKFGDHQFLANEI